jgi:hypothetical protein
MGRFLEKLLAIVLVLLLGLSPLQNALADIACSSGQEAPVSMVDCMHGGDMVVTDQPTHDCEQCDIGQSCASHACSSSHCASSGMAILPTLSYPATYIVATKIVLVKDRFESQNLPSLFRPPIA